MPCRLEALARLRATPHLQPHRYPGADVGNGLELQPCIQPRYTSGICVHVDG